MNAHSPRGHIDACHYCPALIYPKGSKEARANPEQTATKDHIRPQSLARSGSPKGPIVLACSLCNGLKGDTPYEVFVFWRKNTKAKTREGLFQDYARFKFELLCAGFRAAHRLAIDLRPSPVISWPPPQGRGHCTPRDMRRRA